MKKVILIVGLILWFAVVSAQPWGTGGSGSGTVDTGGTPEANDFAKFSDSNTLTGRSYSETRTDLGLVIGTNVQAYDADLTTYAGITPSVNIQTLLGSANYAAVRTSLGLVVGTNVQAYDADLTSWAGITPSANGGSLVSAANYAAMRGLLDLEAGTDFNAYDADLADLADGSLTGTKVGFADTDSNFTATNVQAAIEEFDDVINGGVPNSATAKVDWSQLYNVPAGFADGTDDGAGGSAVIFDIGDDGGNDSTGVSEIATSGDTNSIFTEPSADKILIDLTKDWPKSDLADTITVADNESTNEENAVLFSPGGDIDGGNYTPESDGDFTYNPSTGTLSVPAINTSAVANPGVTSLDSDAPGTDKTVGFMGWQYVDGADGAENSDWLLQIMQGGTLTTVLAFDESDDQWETTKGFSGGIGTFTTFNLPSSDASPSTTAGQIRHDSTVTGLTTGALAWYDGDEVRYIVDLDVLPSDDAYVVAYNATDDKFYMKADSTGAGGDQLVDIVATAPLLVNGTTNVDNALPGSDADITFSISANPQFTTIELGHASDTTLARSAAGVVTVEGSVLATAAASQTSTHSSPSTTNPLAPTWTTAMHTVWYGATGEIDLPAASGYTGRGIIIYNTGAYTITIDPNSSEVIVRDGTVQTGGVTMTLSSGAGNFVALYCDGARWVTLGFKGTLAAGS
jgi:hypothetical protein